MPYATSQDIIDRYGNDLLLIIADRDNDGIADAVAIEQAAADADAEIDAYLAGRYQLPMAEVPGVLKRVAVDIMIYRLAATADVATDAQQQRYNDAVKLLDKISKGQVSLGFPTVSTPPSSNGAAIVKMPARRFGRGNLL